MGLDMYLYKKTYVKNWNFTEKEEKHHVTVKKGGKVLKHIQRKRISSIVEEVGYWRKANHIHKWFVDNCQDGVDDCGEYYVGLDQLKELRSICETIVKVFDESVTGKEKHQAVFGGEYEEVLYDVDESALADLLPTASGFFFGGTAYNHWYRQDCENTINIINEALEGYDEDRVGWDISFKYSSSW